MDWRYGLCVFSERDEDGFTNLMPDWFGEDDGGGIPLESIHPYGFRSRPRDPDVDPQNQPTRGAGLLYAFDGDEGYAIPTQDPRHAALLEDEGEGGAQIYGVSDAGQVSRLLIAGSSGDITITHGAGLLVKIGSAEAVVGDDALAKALAKAESVSGIVSALQALAVSLIEFGPPVPTNPLTPLAALGATLQTALNALPPIPTTKLRSE